MKLRQLSAKIPCGRQPRRVLQSITGVGWVTAAWTLVTTLNFTSCDTVEALTAYAGLAPMPRQSGAACGIAPRLDILATAASAPHFTWRP